MYIFVYKCYSTTILDQTKWMQTNYLDLRCISVALIFILSKKMGKNVVCHYTFASCISCFKFCTFYSFVGSCLVSIGIKADKNRTDLASSICCRFPYREINIPATFPTHVSGRAGGVPRISRDLTHSEQHVYRAAFPCIIAEMESMGRRRVRHSSVINQ